MPDYKQYQDEVIADVTTVLTEKSSQPILFVGSGFAKRYAQAPNWEELLRRLADDCPNIDKDFAYYRQKYESLPKIGALFAEAYREWAWGKGKAHFPKEYFSEKFPAGIFIKHAVSDLLKKLGPGKKGSYGSAELDAEIAALKNVQPHAIITTNYDTLIERIFPEHERVIGQDIFRRQYLSIGEIFKIHGCVTDPLSIVLTDEDYKVFAEEKTYLTAKLLTYFVEHPLVFIGYSAADQNIRDILFHVDRMVRPSMSLCPNVFLLEWDPNLTTDAYPPRDKVLPVGRDRSIRIKSITASSFEWVFKAFGSVGALDQVNLKLLRALMARTVHLVRTDIPKKYMEVDFTTLEHAVDNGENFARLFGVAPLNDPTQVNATFPHTLTIIGERLGFPGWHGAHALLGRLHDETGIDIKASDNAFHIRMKTGKTSSTSKYSEAAVDLLRRVKNGEPYEAGMRALLKVRPPDEVGGNPK